jgi:hypothetical protein
LIRGTIAEFRHLLVARINPDLLERDLSADDAAAALTAARATPQARLIRGLRLLADALAAARSSGNARLEMETALLRFILQHEDPSLDALAARLAVLEAGGLPPAPTLPATAPGERSRRAGTPPEIASRAAAEEQIAPRAVAPPAAAPRADAPQEIAPPVRASVSSDAPSPRSAEPAETDAPSLQKVRSLWPNVRTRAASRKAALTAVLAETNIVALDGELLTLAVPDRTREGMLRQGLETLRAAIDGVLGRPLEIRITVSSSRPTTSSDPVQAGEDQADLMRYAIDTLP